MRIVKALYTIELNGSVLCVIGRNKSFGIVVSVCVNFSCIQKSKFLFCLVILRVNGIVSRFPKVHTDVF